MSFFPGAVALFSLYGEYVVRFFLVTTGWIFDAISICENSFFFFKVSKAFESAKNKNNKQFVYVRLFLKEKPERA